MEITNQANVAALLNDTKPTQTAPQKPSSEPSELETFIDSKKENEEVKSFLEELVTAEENDNFDANAIAKDAPKVLKDYAEQSGIDLSAALQAKHDSKSDTGKNENSPAGQYADVAGQEDKGFFSFIKSTFGINESV